MLTQQIFLDAQRWVIIYSLQAKSDTLVHAGSCQLVSALHNSLAVQTEEELLHAHMLMEANGGYKPHSQTLQ